MKMTKKLPIRFLLSAFGAGVMLFLVPLANAAVVVASYNFTSGSAASNDSETNTSATGITFGSGISGAAFANNRLEIGGDDTTTAGSGNNLNGELTTAISGNGYATFTVTIPSDVSVNLTSVQFDYGTGGSLGAFRFGIGAFSDKTGFTLGDQFYDRFQSTGTTSYPAEQTSLAGEAALQNLTNTSVEFRIYIGDESGSPDRIHFFDNISLSGDVSVIPEPSSTSLMVGILSLLMIRRRR